MSITIAGNIIRSNTKSRLMVNIINGTCNKIYIYEKSVYVISQHVSDYRDACILLKNDIDVCRTIQIKTMIIGEYHVAGCM